MNRTLEFQALSWYCDDGQRYPDRGVPEDSTAYFVVRDYECTVHIFGRTLKGESVCVHAQNFCPSIYLHLQGAQNESDYFDVVSILNRKLGLSVKQSGGDRNRWYAIEHMCDGEVDGGNDMTSGVNMYGFTNMQKINVRRMRFKSLWAYKKTLSLLRKVIGGMEKRHVRKVLGTVKLLEEFKGLVKNPSNGRLDNTAFDKRCDNSSDPELFRSVAMSITRNASTIELAHLCYEGNARLYNVMEPQLQFFHDRGVKPAGWISVNFTDQPTNYETRPRKTRCDLEYEVLHDFISPMDKVTICPEILEMSFDIEVDSFDERFPDAEDIRNVVFQIGVTFKKYGHKEIRKLLLHYGCPCDPIEGAEVRVFETETDLLLGFRDLIVKEQPDICWGWNIDGFDNNYLHIRARLLGVTGYGLYSPLLGYECFVEKQKFSSSAQGDNEFLRVTVPGWLSIDAMIYCKRDTTNPMESYKLDNVAKVLLNDRKKDVPPQQIFRHYKSRDPHRVAIVGDYCIQDTILVQRIADELLVVDALVAMANLCIVPVSDLVTRGQQIKMFSLLFGYAARNNFLIPWFSGFDASIYPKGALVLEPKIGYFKDPVTTLDYSALYPSIMRAYRICYSTCVMDPQWDNVEGIIYEEVVCELEKRVTMGVEDARTKKMVMREVATPFTRRVRFAQNVPSLLPEMQEEFAQARARLKKAKADAKKQGNDMLYRVMHAQEIAVKVSSNSLYGFTGAYMLKMLEITGSVTAKGRELIELTKSFMESDLPQILVNEGFCTSPPPLEVIGGDSVLGDTPVLVYNSATQRMSWIAVEDLEHTESDPIWETYSGSKQVMFPTMWDYIWTEQGFSKIKRLIRHETHKEIYRIRTCCGIVDVTSDHSLLTAAPITEVKPNEVHVGDALLHAGCLPEHVHVEDPVLCGEKIRGAHRLGRFYAARTTGTLRFSLDQGASGFGGVFKNAVSQSILNAPLEVTVSYLLGYLGLPLVEDLETLGTAVMYHPMLLGRKCSVMGKVAVAQLFHLLDRMALGLHLVASEHEAVWNIEVRPWCSHEHHRIESIEKRTNDGSNYVYDFETHNHHFGVGPGLLVVHNTDSVFTLFPNFDVKTAIRAGILAASIMTDKVINRHPLKLEFEKTQVPFVVIAKKRYLARKFESLDDEKGTVYGQGLATKRRNYCPLVKTVYEDLIQTLMLDLEGGPKQCLVRLKGHLQRLVDAHLEKTTEELAAQDDDDDEDEADAIVEEVMTPAARKLVDPLSLPLTIKDFCISASLRAESSYKGVNPLPHVALARRMKERDPASAPRPGDRFAYVVIMESKRGDALSENTEDPTYAQAHNLPLDRLYYLNQQLHNPIVQFMAVLGQKDATSALFDACAKKLQPIHHQTRHNIRDIRSYFGPKK